MARMTRTQISLEERQYAFLKARASEDRSSLSAVLREMIDRMIAEAATNAPSLMTLAGAWEGGGASGADHDRPLADQLGRRKAGGT